MKANAKTIAKEMGMGAKFTVMEIITLAFGKMTRKMDSAKRST